MVNQIAAIIHTLNSIEVHGKQNLDMLLGTIMSLEQIQKELSKKEEVKKTDA